MANLPSYDQSARDEQLPEDVDPQNSLEISSAARIAFRKQAQDALVSSRYQDVVGLVDLYISQQKKSSDQRLLEGWKISLLGRLFEATDGDDTYCNLYMTQNYSKIFNQVRELVGRKLLETSPIRKQRRVKDKYAASEIVKDLKLVAREVIRLRQLQGLVARIAGQQSTRARQIAVQRALAEIIDTLCRPNDWNLRCRDNWMKVYDEF